MKSMFRLGAALVVVSVLPACATVVRGTKTTYHITSSPPEADVALSTGQTCRTPCKLKLKRKDGFEASITKAGYVPQTAKVESKISGGGGAAAAGNILIGGIIGGVVDGTTGALNSFFPSRLDVTLQPQAASVAAPVAEPAPVPATDAPATPGAGD